MSNFWEKLPKPFFCLAPMYDVTDAAFRQMFVKYSKSLRSPTSGSLEVGLQGEVRNATSSEPEVVFRTFPSLILFTEFVSADGLASEQGREKLKRELYFEKNEHSIVAQIFGANPETIKIAVKLIKDLGFDGVDINMGCPDRAVEKQGAGSALIKNSKLAQEIILAAKSVAGEMPVSVKTRLGYNKIDLTWIEKILQAKPDALTVHLRTRKEMSEVEAHYEVIPDLVRLTNEAGVPLIINGDIKSVEEGELFAREYGVDGLMIGRGAFGKPWLFASPVRNEDVRNATSSEPRLPCVAKHCGQAEVVFRASEPDLKTKLNIMLEHSQLFEKLYLPGPTNNKLFHGHAKNFAVMRKHFKAYVSGFRGATVLRDKLMQTQNSAEVEKIINDFFA